MALAYSDLHKHMLPDLPDCETGVIHNALVRAGRALCRATEALHEELAPILAVDYQGNYTLAHRESDFVSTLTPHRLRSVFTNGSEQDVNHYDLYRDSKLAFRSQYIPQELDNMMLLGATTTKDAYTDYTGTSDGAFVIDLGGTEYAISGVDFTAALSMDDVAHTIQTAIRATVETQAVNVVWHIDNFILYMDSGLIGYLSAPSAGTDLSDTYLKGLTGDATLGGYILCDVTFLPTENHTALPEWFMNRYWEVIVSGAMVDLLTMERMPWANAKLAMSKYYPLWKEIVEDATGENFTEYKTADAVAVPQDFVV